MPVCKLNCIVGHSQASMLKMPCNGSLSAYKCSIPIYRKITIERHFEKFTINFQATNTLPNHGYFSCYTYIDFSRKFTKSVKKHVLYLFNRVKGKCMSIIYQFDAYCIKKRLLIEYKCIDFVIQNLECKYGNLQSDFPGFYRNRV